MLRILKDRVRLAVGVNRAPHRRDIGLLRVFWRRASETVTARCLSLSVGPWLRPQLQREYAGTLLWIPGLRLHYKRSTYVDWR